MEIFIYGKWSKYYTYIKYWDNFASRIYDQLGKMQKLGLPPELRTFGKLQVKHILAAFEVTHDKQFALQALHAFGADPTKYFDESHVLH